MSNDSSTVSQAKLLANLMNAQQSTGPKTEAGKAKSRMNALRHGLTGQFYVMNEPDRLAYNTFEKDFLAVLAPVGAVERQLAVSLAQNNWRLNRARALESNLEGLGHQEFAAEADADSPEVEAAVAHAKNWLENHPSMTNLTLYESRIERMVTRAEKRLEALQSVRKALEAKAIEEAELLLRYSLIKRESIRPEQEIEVDGFVFSASAILKRINRKLDLAGARFYQANNWDAQKTFNGTPSLSLGPDISLPKAA